MTNQTISEIAMRQSALELGCEVADLYSGIPKTVVSTTHERARKYLTLPFDCQLVSYGSNVVASARSELVEAVDRYIHRYPAEHCFETPNLHVLSKAIEPYGLKLCFMAEYFLPDLNALRPLPCSYEMRLLTPSDFADLYTPEWSNALCEKRRELDTLAVGAYDGGKLIALAGASADCNEMWQIGIDVLPNYRRRGIASALTARLALEIIARNKVPFYCAAWSNIASVRNAIRSGFRPAWVELTAKKREFVDEMNR